MANFNTYRSCLIPYENEIVALRRKRPPMPFSQIAELLREKYKITVNRQAIFKFIKVRAKGYQPCQYAWSIELSNNENNRIDELPSLRKTQSLQSTTTPVSAKPKTSTVIQPDDDFDMPFSETYNLTRLSPEEAAARLQKIKERNKQ